jgi:hypothetical protein
MQASTSISKKDALWRSVSPYLFVLALFSAPVLSHAAEQKSDRSIQPEDEDFSSAPFNDYAEFNEEEEETEDVRFYQNGRFFGVSIGTGFEGVTGNRGLLWQGGFPVIDFRVHYWFNFNMAMDMGFFNAPHNFFAKNQGDAVDVKLFQVGINIKYYFDTKNLSAPISFANPYVLLGGGAYTKTESSVSAQTQTPETTVGIGFGGGLEFAIKPKKVAFSIESKIHFVTFKDTYLDKYKTSNSLPDLTGFFYTLTGSVLFTW